MVCQSCVAVAGWPTLLGKRSSHHARTRIVYWQARQKRIWMVACQGMFWARLRYLIKACVFFNFTVYFRQFKVCFFYSSGLTHWSCRENPHVWWLKWHLFSKSLVHLLFFFAWNAKTKNETESQTQNQGRAGKECDRKSPSKKKSDAVDWKSHFSYELRYTGRVSRVSLLPVALTRVINKARRFLSWVQWEKTHVWDWRKLSHAKSCLAGLHSRN